MNIIFTTLNPMQRRPVRATSTCILSSIFATYATEILFYLGFDVTISTNAELTAAMASNALESRLSCALL